MNNPLRIQLFGTLQFRFNDTSRCPLKKSGRAQLLFAYLLLNRKRSCSRDEIAYRFWPDTTDRQARTNLRKLIYDVRKLVPHLDELILIDDAHLQWQPSFPVSLDIKDFEQALAVAPRQQDICVQQTALQDAVELYAADLLLGHYEEWILPERDRLHDLHIKALEELMLLAEQRRDFRCAIRYGHRLLRHERLHESTYCRLIRLYRLSGERGPAIKIYEQCEKVLYEMLDVIPCPETRAEFSRVI